MTNPSLMLIMRLALLGCFWTFSAAVSDDMIKISSAELKDLRPETETVLAFFTRSSGCSSCAAAADELRSVLPSLGMKTYLVEDGKETAEYADRVPALVMFHGHTPVLYEGPMEGDAFAEFVTTNREPRVVILNDDSFEHLTQAATGSTTGDWLVMFHGLSCDSCAALEARLQGVAAKLRNRVMVAKMSSETDGRETAKRFGVPPKELQILFFRQGTMYLYNLKKFDLSSLSAFAVGLYKEAPSEPVPSLPQSPIMLVLQVIAVILVAVYILMMVLTKKNEQARKKGF